MKIQNYLWAAPFLSFLAGYFIIERISRIEQLETPAIVGKQLQPAVAQLSTRNLNLRLIAQKEDPDLPQGTILSQTPAAGQKIKPHQALHVVISKKPPALAAPYLINKTETLIAQETEALGIRAKSYYLPSPRPIHSCIAQLPAPGIQLQDGKITTYLSSGNEKSVLVPDFRGKTVPEVTDFLQRYNVSIEITHPSWPHKNHTCDENCAITDQRPLAGSIVTLNGKKPLLIQLQAQQA